MVFVAHIILDTSKSYFQFHSMQENYFSIVKDLSLLTLFLGLILYGNVNAQIPDPVKFSIVSVPDTVMAGEPFEIELNANIEGDWHLYSH